jgi:probable F420-dependent oxidoreductase
MPEFQVGVQLHPQDTTIERYRDAWQQADALGVDSIWTWDHFFPLYGDARAAHFEGYSLLAAMAVDTQHASIGALVTCNSYRNPELLADMARTIDHLSGGRFVLGLGAGWFKRDYDEYGYEFGTAGSRLRDLGAALPRIRARLAALNPEPKGALPILIGGSGEKVTLRLTAQYADAWNTFGPPSNFRAKSAVLDRWCKEVGRAPDEVARTVAINPGSVDDFEEYLDAGATHIIVMTGAPYDLAPVQRLLEHARH